MLPLVESVFLRQLRVGSCRSRWTPPGVSVKNPDTDFGVPSNVSFGSIPDLPATLGRCRRIGRIGSREAAQFGSMRRNILGKNAGAPALPLTEYLVRMSEPVRSAT